MGLYLLMAMGFFNGLLQACIYAGIGKTQPTITNSQGDITIMMNLVGVSYLCAFDSFLNMTFGTILSFP